MSVRSESIQPPSGPRKLRARKRRAVKQAVAKAKPHRVGDELLLVWPDASCEVVKYLGDEDRHGTVRARVDRAPTELDYFDDPSPLVPHDWLMRLEAA